MNEWAIVAAAVGLAVVVTPAWRVSRGWVTVAHELGHALAAIVAEGRVRRIRVERDTSGVTEWSGTAVDRRIPRGFVAWWGYPAPGMGALLVAVTVAVGHAVVGLGIIAVASLAVLVVWIRSAWGVTLVVVVGVVAGAGAWAGGTTATAVSVGLATLWGVGGVRAAAAAAPRARRGDGSDQATLAENLFLPVAFWSATMVVMAVALAAGAAALVVPAVS